MASRAVLLPDFRPSRRIDDVAWSRVRIDEIDEIDAVLIGSGDDFEWSEVETIDLDPLDKHPDRPELRSFSTSNATKPWLRVVFLDGDDIEDEPSAVFAVDGPPFRPTVAQISSILRARTYSSDQLAGEQVGVFNESTRPTGNEIRDEIVPAACSDITLVTGRIPGVYLDEARRIAALRAAAEIERSYIPEAAEGPTIYQTLRITFEEELEKLRRNIESLIFATRGLL